MVEDADGLVRVVWASEHGEANETAAAAMIIARILALCPGLA